MSIGERFLTKAEFETWVKQIERRLAALEIKEIEISQTKGWSGEQPIIANIEVDGQGHVTNIQGKAIFARNGLIDNIG
jgi:hypothetical protein